jgi:hypothetical protein
MPDHRSHRGPHPNDHALFAPAHWPALRSATFDLSWLLEHGYVIQSALKLTGDRYALTARQRAAVSRCACPQTLARVRLRRMQPVEALVDADLAIDGFNVLTTLEVALSGGVVLIGRDAVMRDIAGVHGSYRSVEETIPALLLLRETLRALHVGRCEWLLDAPVSNSGRLCCTMMNIAAEHGLPWTARVVPDPDRLLADSPSIVASADGQVLDAAARCCNLARLCIEGAAPRAFVVDLSTDP